MMETGYAVAGRYKIIRPIGEGGMANVYLARGSNFRPASGS
ncbi:hypothetical protein QY886_06635 [Latilactobacillus sakei]